MITKLAIENFEKNLEAIDKGEYSNELLKDDEYEVFEALSDFTFHRITPMIVILFYFSACHGEYCFPSKISAILSQACPSP